MSCQRGMLCVWLHATLMNAACHTCQFVVVTLYYVNMWMRHVQHKNLTLFALSKFSHRDQHEESHTATRINRTRNTDTRTAPAILRLRSLKPSFRGSSPMLTLPPPIHPSPPPAPFFLAHSTIGCLRMEQGAVQEWKCAQERAWV